MAKDANDGNTKDLNAVSDKAAWLTPAAQTTILAALTLKAAQLKRQINTESNDEIKQIHKRELAHITQLINIV